MSLESMSTEATVVDWPEANQRYLIAMLAVVRLALEHHAGEEPQNLDALEQELREAEAALPAPSALDSLCAIFGLSSFERDVLLLVAGPELDAGFASLCAAAQGNPERTYPTFGLALATLPEAHWSALAADASLRHWRLVEVGDGNVLTAAPLAIDERILCFLTGVYQLDERLAGLVMPIEEVGDAPASHLALAAQLTEIWSQAESPEECPLFQLCGVDQASKRALVAAACAEDGLQAFRLNAGDIPSSAAERESLARLWEREAALGGGVLVIEHRDDAPAESLRPLTSMVERLTGRLVLASREPLGIQRFNTLRFDVEKPAPPEQVSLWHDELGDAAAGMNGEVAAVAAQFQLGLQGIRAAGAQVRANLAHNNGHSSEHLLWDACRVQSRPRLDDLAQRIEPAARWDDLVLPESQKQALREIAIHVQQRPRVYGTWGFAARGSRGLGISALFAGESGTGKTMAAEVLANELRLDLYRIDLAAVVSKYIGETEKNLRRIFDVAEDGGAILLFDEADALFGKRSQVKDSHDRYANIEVSYLLQRMESYRGLAILTTNLRKSLDKAFLRRLRFIVNFPFPDESQRAEIWRRIFPPETPTEALDAMLLARLTLTGGNIRNIAMNAAFLAANADKPVRHEHLVSAARSEYAKLEKTLTDAEIGGLL